MPPIRLRFSKRLKSFTGFSPAQPDDFVDAGICVTSSGLFLTTRKSNLREVTVSQANAFGAQSGTMDKAARGMKVEKLGPGVYKVTTQEDLTEGEYAFYNGGGVGPSGGASCLTLESSCQVSVPTTGQC